MIFSLQEKEYLFADISGIELNGYLQKTRLILDVTVYPKNAQQFRLFDSGNLPTNAELNVLRFLKQQHIPISIIQLPSERDYERIKVDDQNADEARNIFEEI